MTKLTQERPGDVAVASPLDVVVQVDGADVGATNPLPVYETAIDASTDDIHDVAANVASIVSYPATPTVYHVISGIAWSYNAAPTAGRLFIVMNGSTVFDIDITAAGPGFIPFDPPKRFGVGDAVSVTLAAGGAGVVGTCNVLGHWTE
jgi:hypothetical protein